MNPVVLDTGWEKPKIWVIQEGLVASEVQEKGSRVQENRDNAQATGDTLMSSNVRTKATYPPPRTIHTGECRMGVRAGGVAGRSLVSTFQVVC